MWISQFITRRVITVSPRETVLEARELMTNNRIRHLPVVDADNFIMGIVSDRDIRGAFCRVEDGGIFSDDNAPLVAEIMTTNPLCISPSFTLQDALLQFRMRKVGAFPVVDEDDRVIGILSDRDLLNAFIQVLGLGSPGCFIGILLDPSEEEVKTVLELLADRGFPIASMLVIRDWQPDAWAIFLYLLTQNRSASRKAVSNAGFSLIEPLEWLLVREAQSAA